MVGSKTYCVLIVGALTDYIVCDRITLNWGSGSSPFVWSDSNTTLKMLTDESHLLLNDISLKIKHRATIDYGLKVIYMIDKFSLK